MHAKERGAVKMDEGGREGGTETEVRQGVVKRDETRGEMKRDGDRAK